MGLQCFLFTADEAIAGTIRLVLAGLDVQGESCAEAVTAAERIANQAFQIVIIDWDQQPEAGLLLTTARQRKASERPITLAIVSDDASVPKALQAGANSILRKPIVVNQVKDTLMTARDLLRSKREPGAAPIVAKQAAAAGISAGPALGSGLGLTPAVRTSLDPGKDRDRDKDKTLRAGEFLHSAATAPGGSFETDSDVAASMHEAVPEPVDPLKDLEPMASSVATADRVASEPAAPAATEHRGLEWHLKNRGISRPTAVISKSSATSAAAAPAPAPEKPELLGYETASSPSNSTSATDEQTPAPIHENQIQAKPKSLADDKKEAELFSHIDGEASESEETPKRSFRIGKGTTAALVVVLVCAAAAAPQAPWHSKMQVLWARGQRVLHAWLNPQPVTPAQAPVSHENFARAGDEYKLPAAEAIPDATTDPSQIQVVPVIDPTKKPTGDAANQAATPADGATATPADQAQTPAQSTPEGQPAQSTAEPQPKEKEPQSFAPVTVAQPIPAPSPITSAAPTHTDSPAQVPVPVSSGSAPAPAPAKTQPVRAPSMPDHIPSSLKSQLASTTPELSGSKSPDSAMASIEPVTVAEGAERALLIDQPAIAYPANSKGLQGTVILQVLIGRDGTVQDAKFLQGSLAFARTAIDGVKQWKFKPYNMNGRAVSVQTLLTLTFKPGA